MGVGFLDAGVLAGVYVVDSMRRVQKAANKAVSKEPHKARGRSRKK